MLVEHDICRHDAPMQRWRVTRQGCIGASGDRLGVYEPYTVGMMFEWGHGELLAKTGLMHHDDQGHDVLRHHAALEGLTQYMPCCKEMNSALFVHWTNRDTVYIFVQSIA